MNRERNMNHWNDENVNLVIINTIIVQEAMQPSAY